MRKLITIFVVVAIITAIIWRLVPSGSLPEGKTIDRIIVFKKKQIMQVMSNGDILKTYSIALGRDPKGHKVNQGDKRTPEGDYVINDKNPLSAFHKNLGISYPNALDILNAKLKGLDPGGDIKIHGIRNGVGFIGKFHRLFNWTAGCIAVTDEEIDELYDNVKVGTPITILP